MMQKILLKARQSLVIVLQIVLSQILTGAAAFFLFTSCASGSFLEDFDHLKNGMDRADTLERLGPPIRKERRDDKDWWYYSGYDKNFRYEKMLVFKDDHLVYAGKVAAPPNVKSAEQMDQEIQAQNENLELENEKLRAKAVPGESPPSPMIEEKPEQ